MVLGIRLSENNTKAGLAVTFSAIDAEGQPLIPLAIAHASREGLIGQQISGNTFLTMASVEAINISLQQSGIGVEKVFDVTTQQSGTEATAGQDFRTQEQKDRLTSFQERIAKSTSNIVGVLNPFTETPTATQSPGLPTNEAVDSFFDRPDLFVSTSRQTGIINFFDRTGIQTSSIDTGMGTNLPLSNGNGISPSGIGIALLIGVLALAAN